MSPKALPALLAVLVATPGLAQVSFADKIPQNYTFNAADCGEDQLADLRYEFTVENLTMVSYALYLYENFDTCPQLQTVTPTRVIQDFGSFVSLTAANRFLPSDEAEDVIAPRKILGDEICDDGVRSNYILCLYLADVQPQVDAGIPIVQNNVFLDEATEITVDTSIPGRPTLGTPVGKDNAVTLAIENRDDITDDGESITYVIQYRSCDPDAVETAVDGGTITGPDGGVIDTSCGAVVSLTEVSQSSLTVSGLTNDVDYEFRVALVDNFDNQGPFSAFVTATPDPGFTPGSTYNGDPNPLSVKPPSGGCDPGLAAEEADACGQTESEPGFPVLRVFGAAMLAAMLIRRRRRRSSAALLGLLVFGLAGSAAAYPGQVTASFKVGPYIPSIDLEEHGGTNTTGTNGPYIYPVYRCFFQTSESFPPRGILPMPEIDVDFHLFDLFGSLELGVGVAGMQARGKAFANTPENAALVSDGRCGVPGDNDVEFSLLLIKPRLSYRFDVLHDYLGIPLVPYGRGALIGAGYAFSRDGKWDQNPLPAGASANAGGHRNPLGARLGFEGALGLQVGVNWVDLVHMWTLSTHLRSILRTGKLPKARPKSRVGNIYFFLEAVYSEIDTFRQPGIKLGPRDPFFGGTLPYTINGGFTVELN